MHFDKRRLNLPLGWAPAYPTRSTFERRSTRPDTKSPIQNTDPCGETVLTATWLKPDESIARLEPVVKEIKKIRNDASVKVRGIVGPMTGLNVSQDAVRQTRHMFLDVLMLLLVSHIEVVRHLNSVQYPYMLKKLIGGESITCDIPWNEALGIPSHPTLAADAKSYPKIFRTEDRRLSALCESFSGWSLYAAQKELCACNSRLKVKDLTIEILVNHILKSANDWLSVRQLVGLRSEDPKRLEKHYYEDKVSSRFVDSLLIISDVSADISIKKGSVQTSWSTNPPEQFKIDKFQAQIASVVGNFLKTPEAKGGE